MKISNDAAIGCANHLIIQQSRLAAELIDIMSSETATWNDMENQQAKISCIADSLYNLVADIASNDDKKNRLPLEV